MLLCISSAASISHVPRGMPCSPCLAQPVAAGPEASRFNKKCFMSGWVVLCLFLSSAPLFPTLGREDLIVTTSLIHVFPGLSPCPAPRTASTSSSFTEMGQLFAARRLLPLLFPVIHSNHPLHQALGACLSCTSFSSWQRATPLHNNDQRRRCASLLRCECYFACYVCRMWFSFFFFLFIFFSKSFCLLHSQKYLHFSSCGFQWLSVFLYLLHNNPTREVKKEALKPNS